MKDMEQIGFLSVGYGVSKVMGYQAKKYGLKETLFGHLLVDGANGIMSCKERLY
eukprot:m.34990 g.34990  ORF g.34990 m.34990 type:complete len:54 (+) comp8814_c0_seq1:537-698(+)